MSIRSVRNRDFAAEYKQSVFWHTSLGLNRQSYRSFEIVLRCLEPASTQTSYSNTLWIPVCITHEPKKGFLIVLHTTRVMQTYPQPKSFTILCKHYEKYRICSPFNEYHSWYLYTYHSINIEWDSGLSGIE